MAFNFTTLRESIAMAILPKPIISQNTVQNTFNKALLNYIGGGLTKYDYDGKVTLEKGYNQNSDVYSVVSQIARKFSSVPANLNKVVNKREAKLLKDLYTKQLDPQSLARKRILEVKAYGNEEVEEPLEKPNYFQSDTEFKELWETFMLLNGNAYQWIFSPEAGLNEGKPMARFLLPSHLVQIVLKDNAQFETLESPVSHYILIIGDRFAEFKESDVIHSKFPNPNYDLIGSHFYGQSPLKSALLDIQISNSTKENNLGTMQSGGVYGFIHAKDGQTPLNETQANELKSRLVEMKSSSEVLGRISGASAPLGFTQVSVDTDRLMPFDFLKSSQKAICNNLGWSDLLLNNEGGAKYDNLDAVWRMAISNRIAPDLKIYEDGLNDKFYPRFKDLGDVKITFDISELPEMQNDMVTLVSWLSKALENGAITPREFRIALRYSDIDTEQMNTHFLRGGLLPLEDAIMPDQQILGGFNLGQ
jgi:HK97 family phage portal protein